MERESHEEADERREAVMASAASLRPDFKLKSGINESQLSKFQVSQQLSYFVSVFLHFVCTGTEGT